MASSLMSEIRSRLQHREYRRLIRALKRYQAHNSCGYTVANAGAEILNNVRNEKLVPNDTASEFAETCAKLFDASANNTPVTPNCCKFHSGLAKSLALNMRPHSRLDWVRDFFEIAWVMTLEEPILRSSLSPSKKPPLLFSRFIILDRLIAEHYRAKGRAPDIAKQVASRLAPSKAKSDRINFLDLAGSSRFDGQLGNFPNPRGPLKAKMPCPRIRSFATPTRFVTRTTKNRGRPDVLLQKLGIPFELGKKWVEFIYPFDRCAYHDDNADSFLVYPCFIDSYGNWAWRPDREASKWNYARCLDTNGRGLPELLHVPVDFTKIEDAIVWSHATSKHWPGPKIRSQLRIK